MMPWTRRVDRRGVFATVVLARGMAACALGVEGDDDAAVIGEPVAAVEAGTADTGASEALPPWLANPQFEAGGQGVAVVSDGGTRVSAPASSVPDAARPTRLSDAGSTRPARADASAPPTPARCQESTCTNTCSLAGPLKCCTEAGRCGCSWAPGAYCM
jgi:hypothetical protein